MDGDDLIEEVKFGECELKKLKRQMLRPLSMSRSEDGHARGHLPAFLGVIVSPYLERIIADAFDSMKIRPLPQLIDSHCST
jgi:hypothetical protein